MLTVPDLPHPVIVSKNPGFRALYIHLQFTSYLARQNEIRFFFV